MTHPEADRGLPRVFIFGITGGVGSRLARTLRLRGDAVSGLVRGEAQARHLRSDGVEAVLGDLTETSPHALARHMRDGDATVFTTGAGSCDSSSSPLSPPASAHIENTHATSEEGTNGNAHGTDGPVFDDRSDRHASRRVDRLARQPRRRSGRRTRSADGS
ncbi:NAD(P)H-binding protein [Microbacterium sp.]|uniref:NAD(P)H-binding protein n=1 Tax=Microbacterium sp. TaxID=51671 RepID=UPI0039C90800